MIIASNLYKAYGKKIAVDDVSFSVETGKVTGFLGPNGAGKSTTMRLMLGLDKGTGTTTYDGKSLFDYAKTANIVGILLEAKAFHPSRSAENHLRVLASAGGIDDRRVKEVLGEVGLIDVARKKPGKFSLGMSQRLGIAAAILGEPKYLILDEPANGLDPEGIAWLRKFLKDYAKKGNAVLISSHLLNEIALMADNVIVLGKGKLITSSSASKFTSASNLAYTFVRSKDLQGLENVLKTLGKPFQKMDNGFSVRELSTDKVGEAVFAAKIPILELTSHNATLEESFLELTNDSQEYRAVKGGKL